MQNCKELWISRIYFPMKNPMDRARATWVDRGVRQRRQEGVAAP
jgi:hypothetical protein